MMAVALVLCVVGGGVVGVVRDVDGVDGGGGVGVVVMMLL